MTPSRDPSSSRFGLARLRRVAGRTVRSLRWPRRTTWAAWLSRPVMAPARIGARLRLRRRQPGAITVVTVNWNSVEFLRVLIDAVRRYSPDDVRIIVVDNASTDGSRAFLRERRDVETVALPINVGHGAALDLGFLRARTEFVVALDVDAFPIREGWLDELIGPLKAGAAVSGAHLHRRYAHPCCLAMRLDRFVLRWHTFRLLWPLGHRLWDTGERISMRERPRVHLIERTSVRGPGPVGSVFGGFVYHNFFSTRFGDVDEMTVFDGVVRRDDPRQAWDEAMARYFGAR